MSASTRTVQQTQGTGQIAAAFLAVVLAMVLAAVVGFGQLTATKSHNAPAAVPAPVFLDRGSRDEIGTPVEAPVFLDRGSRDEIGTGGAGSGGWNGPRLRPQ